MSRIFEVIEGWSKLHIEERHKLYSLLYIIRLMKSRRRRWTGLVTSMGAKANAYRILLEEKERRRLGKSRRIIKDNIKMDLR
jgi:hypothetical protein